MRHPPEHLRRRRVEDGRRHLHGLVSLDSTVADTLEVRVAHDLLPKIFLESRVSMDLPHIVGYPGSHVLLPQNLRRVRQLRYKRPVVRHQPVIHIFDGFLHRDKLRPSRLDNRVR